MRAYLERYRGAFDLTPRIRFKTPVEQVRRDSNGGWIVRAKGRKKSFSKVVVATGRYNKPHFPDVPGIDSFSGSCGLAHTFQYKNPDIYRGRRVVVAGSSISPLEIASEVAMLGAARVVLSCRKQQDVFPKLIGGIPIDHIALTRFTVLAAETFPMQAVGAAMKQLVLRASGSPEQCGALKPSEDIFEADFTLSQHFLPLVAEGRIHVKPWIETIKGQTIHFVDSSSEDADGLIFGTGFDLNLSFLSDELRATLNIYRDHIDLYKFTFHPDLDGLAFLGVFRQAGPYYPVLELQARWIAYLWSGALPALSRAEMEADIQAYRARRGGPQEMPMPNMAILFARTAGVEPDLRQWPNLHRALLFGPLAPVSFRLNGRDALADAPARFVEESRAFGAITSNEFTAEQSARLQALASARNDPAFAELLVG